MSWNQAGKTSVRHLFSLGPGVRGEAEHLPEGRGSRNHPLGPRLPFPRASWERRASSALARVSPRNPCPPSSLLACPSCAPTGKVGEGKAHTTDMPG